MTQKMGKREPCERKNADACFQTKKSCYRNATREGEKSIVKVV